MKPQLININLTHQKSVEIKIVDDYYLRFPFHFHNLCELVLIVESFGKRVVGDHVGNFKAGDLVLIGPNLPHVWINDSSFTEAAQQRVRAVVVYFSTDLLLQLSDEEVAVQEARDLIKNASRGLRFRGSTLVKARSKLLLLPHRHGLRKIFGFLEILQILFESKDHEHLASVGFKSYSFSPGDAKKIDLVYQFVLRNFQRDVRLSEVAALVNMSPSAFSRFFRLRTKLSFSRFLNDVRIGHACKLLQTEELTIAEVCYQSGYNNLANFNKFFKLITAFTPTCYRKELHSD